MIFFTRLFLSLVLFSPLLAISQWQFQAGIGPIVTKESTVSTIFDESTSLNFTRDSEAFRAAVLATYLLKDKWEFRTGLEGQNPLIIADIFIFQDDPDRKQRVFVEIEAVNLFVPLELKYSAKEGLYFNAGVMANFMIDITNYGRWRDQIFGNISQEELNGFVKIVENKLRPVNLSYRVGVGVKYRSFGLEFGYDQLLTNVIRTPFQYDGTDANMKWKYSDLHFKFLYIFQKKDSN